MRIGIKTYTAIAIITGVIIGLATILVAAWLSGCDTPPRDTPPPEPTIEPREEPLAYPVFQDKTATIEGDSLKGYILPQALIDQGEVFTLPGEGIALPFLVPKRGVTVAYKFQWAPPESAYITLAIATVDSLDAGIVWIAVSGTLAGDRVRLIVPWEGYDK